MMKQEQRFVMRLVVAVPVAAVLLLLMFLGGWSEDLMNKLDNWTIK